MITHTVLFRLTRPVEAPAAAALHSAVESFGAAPPHALGPAEILTDAALRPEGRSVSESGMVVRFADAEAFAAYLADPAHVEFVEGTLLVHCETWLSIQTES